MGSADVFQRVRARLARGNETVGVLALGASVTAMFASVCLEMSRATHDGVHVCSTGPNETLAEFEARAAAYKSRQGYRAAPIESDWL
eukprot:539451-Prymnesium_polylepis.1